MSRKQPAGAFSPVRTMRKFFVSSFVVLTFVAYALHEHFVNPNAANAGLASQGFATTGQPPADPPTNVPAAPPTDVPAAPPTDVPNLPPTLAPSAPQADVPATSVPAPTARPVVRATPTLVPKPTVQTAGQYKDGSYTGPEVDAYWGFVKIQAVVRNGKLADVQFLEYPSDRRTSQRINSVAIPYLQSEALQVQDANVDIVSGATLTSEAFAQSLQVALASAKN